MLGYFGLSFSESLCVVVVIMFALRIWLMRRDFEDRMKK